MSPPCDVSTRLALTNAATINAEVKNNNGGFMAHGEKRKRGNRPLTPSCLDDVT